MRRDSAEDGDDLLARGVDRYADGDIAGALALWLRAAKLQPTDERIRGYVDWAVERLRAEDPAALSALGLPEPVEPLSVELFEAAETPPRRRPGAPLTTDEAEASIVIAPAPPGPLQRHDTVVSWQPIAEEATPAPPPPESLEPRGAEAPVHRFLARTPTMPNLPPIEDVMVLSDERVAALANGLEPDGRGASGAHKATVVSGRSDDRARSEVPAHAAARAHAHAQVPSGQGLSTSRRSAAAAVAAATFADPDTDALPPAPVSRSRFARPASRPRPLPESSPRPDGSRAAGSPHPAPSRPRRFDNPPSAPQAPVARSPLPGETARLVEAARMALIRGDVDNAVLVAERAILVAGGLEAAALAPHLPSLLEVYHGVLGSRRRTVRVGDLPDDLDPASAFLLSRVDGTFSVDDLLDVSGMEEVFAARLVVLLVRQGALLLE